MGPIHRLLRRSGLNARFNDVICPEHVKTVWLRADGQIETTIDRKLVFLHAPPPNAMRDVVPATPDHATIRYESPDTKGFERKTGPRDAYLYWSPQKPIVPYAIYPHQLRWQSPGPTREAAISVDITCEHRTGVLGIQAVTPAAFESAVVFKRPRWRELRTEHSLMKEALRQLESGAEKPAVFENGTRVAWYLERPKIGERYIFVAFHEGGVKLWKQRLAATTFGAKLRRLIRLEAR